MSRAKALKAEKQAWEGDINEEGYNIDEELSEEEIGMRFTKLRPEPRDGDQRRNRRDERPARRQNAKMTSYNNTEDFPALDMPDSR